MHVSEVKYIILHREPCACPSWTLTIAPLPQEKGADVTWPFGCMFERLVVQTRVPSHSDPVCLNLVSPPPQLSARWDQGLHVRGSCCVCDGAAIIRVPVAERCLLLCALFLTVSRRDIEHVGCVDRCLLSCLSCASVYVRMYVCVCCCCFVCSLCACVRLGGRNQHMWAKYRLQMNWLFEGLGGRLITTLFTALVTAHLHMLSTL